MKKSIGILLSLLLMFNLAPNLSAQTTDEELDQAELLKQLIGTWESEALGDTVISLLISPHNNGLYGVQENRVHGNTIGTYKVSIGLSDDKKMIIQTYLGPDGTIVLDLGKFVTKNTFVIDRYRGNTTHAMAQGIWEISPNSFKISFKVRGEGMTWPNDWTPLATFKRAD